MISLVFITYLIVILGRNCLWDQFYYGLGNIGKDNISFIHPTGFIHIDSPQESF